MICFFFNDTATTEIYTLSLHDALPIYELVYEGKAKEVFSTDEPDVLIHRYKDDATAFNAQKRGSWKNKGRTNADRKSTRLNSSHANISYAVFCLKKKQSQPPTIHFLLT